MSGTSRAEAAQGKKFVHDVILPSRRLSLEPLAPQPDPEVLSWSLDRPQASLRELALARRRMNLDKVPSLLARSP